MSTDLAHIFDVTLGACLIGFAVSLFLYGTTSGQTAWYFLRYGWRTSSFWTRCYVAALWICDTGHLAILAYTMFYYVVTFHANPSILEQINWAFGTMILVTKLCGVFIRLGYAYRIWKYNDRKIVVPGLVVILSVVFVAIGSFSAVKELRLKSLDDVEGSKWEIYATFVLQLMIDITITLAMFVSYRRFFTGTRSFDNITQIIIIYVVNTGLVSVVLTILTCTFYITFPQSFIWLSTYWVLAKFQTFCLLAVLNAEKTLMERTIQQAEGTYPMLTTAMRVEDVLSQCPPSENSIELASMSTSPRGPLLPLPSPVEEEPIGRKSCASQ